MSRWQWQVFALAELVGALRREVARLRRELEETRVNASREHGDLREQLEAAQADNDRLRHESDDDATRLAVRDNEIERLEIALAEAERDRDALRASLTPREPDDAGRSPRTS